MKTIFARNLSAAAVGVLMLFGLSPAFAMAATLSRSLDIGATGSDVTALQTYLAANPSLYPQGLVTGYFGSLTSAAVARFQCANDIVCSGTPATTGYGRVGPTTMARLNVVMNGGGTVSGDVYAPVISNLNAALGTNAVTVSWTTNESARAKLFYSTAPLSVLETSGPGQEPAIGGAMIQDSSFSTAHSLTIGSLASSTTYYYLVEAVDLSGNVTLSHLMGTFRTNPQ